MGRGSDKNGGVYKVQYSYPPVGGIRSKGLEIGKKIISLKEKKENLVVPKGKI